MMPIGRPLFEVVTPASAEDRRLVPLETIRALTALPSSGAGGINDAGLGALLDAALATMARSCRLAKWRAAPPTLAEEDVRATWSTDYWHSLIMRPTGWWEGPPAKLLLPWRAPITDISIAEGGTELVEGTDFHLLGAGVVERIGACWSTSGDIVVDYTAGFAPLAVEPEDQEGEPMPADLVTLLADQVRMASDRRDIDLNLRSEDIPSTWSGTYNFAGGSAIDTDGLMMPLWDALRDYRAPLSVG